uniref:probable serine/threonine-protein kinase PBL9 n=1 Tax=Erigeron canadensis TaxID=72917 RepID=UPI001CB898D7|nr:probable serine/threonine-protein kinase PBL9 [Erigeron canadensis]
MMLPEQTCRRFTLSEIKLATKKFHKTLVIGHGGFGTVYGCRSKKIGLVSEIAIKRLDSKSIQGASEFEAEVEVLSKLRHGNLVPLIGYCNEGGEMILVYEFMPNGTLGYHLFKGDLSWLQRLKICVGTARGLDYLHTDFGLAKVGPINQTRSSVRTGVKGTFGYMDPCYFYSGKLTRKSDVYAFGIVLFEVLCGKKAVDPTIDKDQWSLAVWAQDQIKEGRLSQLIDSRLMGQISKKCLKEFVSIAGQCLQNQPKMRPTMSEVVVKLESIMSQERKNADISAGKGGLIDKVRFFLTGKLNMMASPAVGSQSERSANDILLTKKGIKIISSRCPRIFTYAELKDATNNFRHKEYSRSLHEIIYKGWLDEEKYAPAESGDGLALYVRQAYTGKRKIGFKVEEFIHPNLVNLLGYCQTANNSLYLVYELIPDASLDKLLFRGTSPLSWVSRLKIAIGAAQGLSFLHQRKQASYRQFMTAVILVDDYFNVRLSDYEVHQSCIYKDSNFFTDRFYASPELRKVQQLERHAAAQIISNKSGMKVFDDNRQQEKQNLVEWATPLLTHEANLRIIIDPQLRHEKYPPKGAFKFALLVSKCLHSDPKMRPCMKEIVKILYECYKMYTEDNS